MGYFTREWVHLIDWDSVCHGRRSCSWQLRPIEGVSEFKANDGYADKQLWTSYPDSAAQTWYFTDDGRIALKDSDQCVDMGEDGTSSYISSTLW
jgi:hypothetical protein